MKRSSHFSIPQFFTSLIVSFKKSGIGIVRPLILLIALLALAAWSVLSVLDIPPPHTLILKSDGWHPRELLVQPGESVTFVNHTGNPFWPASNPHPLHGGYSGFDAGHAVPAGGSWTFTFTKPGKWGLHDHLRSFYSAYIDVGDAAVSYDCAEHLQGANVGTKGLCWEQKLDDELALHGAKAAFQLFAKYYASDSDFTRIGCHLIAHNIGDAAYGEYLRHGKDVHVLQFPPETIYCGYGYYHGILEHLIRDNPDFTVADKFCKMLVKEHESDIPRIRLNCYHAIGHGFIPEPTDVSLWGDVRALTAPAQKACYQIPEDDARVECLQGSFNVIADWMWNNQFGFSFPKTDSLSVCRTFDDPAVSRACYYELSMRVAPLVKESFTDLYKTYVASITNDSIAEMIIDSAVASVVGTHISESNFIPYLKECRLLPERVQKGCMKGLSAAFIAHGEPEKEYVKAIAFCSLPELTAAEKDTCYQNIVRHFKNVYSRQKVADVCTLLETPYRKYCVYE